MRTPVFGDEGLYCYLGYQINRLPVKDSSNLVLNIWKDAPLLPVINAVALRLFPSPAPLWTCRAAVTIAAGLGAVTLFGIGGWGAMLFYLLNPFNFFLDRTVLMEPVLNTAMLGFLSMSLLAMRRGTRKLMILTGLTTALVLTAKQTGILVLPIPFIIALLRRKRFPYFKQVLVTTVVVASGLIWLALRTTRLWDTAAMHTTTTVSILRIKNNLGLMGKWLIQYWSWWVIPVVILGWRSRWALMATYFVLVFATLGWSLFPRYLLIVVPFVALIAGQAAKNLAGKIMFTILLVIFVRRDVTILLQPDKARLALETRYQFFEDWGSGLGTKVAVEWLRGQELSGSTVLLVPQDIQGLWVMSQLSFAPQINLATNFYTNDKSLIDQIEAYDNKPILLVATAHHWQLVNLVKQKYTLQRLLATHGDNRNSVTIDKIN